MFYQRIIFLYFLLTVKLIIDIIRYDSGGLILKGIFAILLRQPAHKLNTFWILFKEF